LELLETVYQFEI